MQIYEGLPITTNKIPPEERKDVPHHLLGCVKLDEEPWTVQQFRDRASKVIGEIESRRKLPILVGGTHYYTQSLLFKDAVVEQEDVDRIAREQQEQKWPILGASTEEVLEELQRVDPVMARRWHPNDRRKIRRSLEIWLTTGRKASEVYYQQRQARTSTDSQTTQAIWEPIESPDDMYERSVTDSNSPLSYDTLIFWTYADSDVLSPRLENRVDKMVSEGLLEEVQSMYDFFQDREQQGSTLDQSRGIWVAIGFKENLPYIMDGNNSEKPKKEGIERTKIATRQYAKRQVRWIRLRLRRALTEVNSADRLFLLDAADLTQWSQNVEEKARDITEAFLGGSTLPKPESLSDAAKEMLVTSEETSRAARHCDACIKTLMSEEEWIGHLKSKGHKSAVRPKVDWRTLHPKDKGQ